VCGGGRGRVHKWGIRLVFGAGALWIVAGGLSYPLALPQLSTWPWNQGWFMFSSDSGWRWRLQIVGAFSDGERREIDVSPWFEVQATPVGGRLQELPRDRATMTALAAYLCASVNRDAPPGKRLRELDVVDWAWPRERGRRVDLDDVPAEWARHRFWIKGFRCEDVGPGVAP
jgi:hypothetical protein